MLRHILKKTHTVHILHLLLKRDLSKEKPLESYEQTPQKLRLRMTFQNFKKRLIARGYAQTLIENLLSDITFTERENALLKHNKEKREVLPFVTQSQPSVST